jgi:release factor glutamine methyltransferase
VSGGFNGLSIDAARRQLSQQLRDASIETPELDARLLAGAAFGLDLTGLAIQAARRLDDAEATRLSVFAQRRLAGEPVARIIGIKEFWGLPLRLSATTLVPRPDTETLVEAAIQSVRESGMHPRRIADLGTGSGALLLALLSEWPDAWGVGSDIDEDALQTAAANARQLGLANRAAFVRCDYAQALSGRFDIIVSNPPYIASAEIAALEVEVRNHDPRRALNGGVDGLDAYRTLVPQAAALLAKGGGLFVEVGQHQSHDVARLMASAGLSPAAPKLDLSGIPRVVFGGN